MDKERIPTGIILAVIAISGLPSLLNLVGVDFGSATGGASGPFVHTLLEWSAVATAFFTAVLALVHFKIKGDVTTPIIGVALFCAGGMDAFHILAADRLIASVANNEQFIPFTWAISRFFNVGIMLVGVGVILRRRAMPGRAGFRFVILTTLAFGFLSYGLFDFLATSARLPVVDFPDAVIKRPYDVPALLLYLFAGTLVYPYLYRRNPSVFTHALIISVIPDVVTQIHMSFGSSVLFDNSFNIAHFIKILAYLVPFTGLTLDYVDTYRLVNAQATDLGRVNTRLRAEIADRIRAGLEVETLAKFPDENPQPVMRVAQDGSLLYANEPARSCLAKLKLAERNTIPHDWIRMVQQALEYGLSTQIEVKFGDQTYILIFAPVRDAGYVNLYGLDITDRKQAEARLASVRAREVMVGAEIQEMFLRGSVPRFTRGVTVDYLSIPAQQMAGDFVDFATHGGCHLDIVVGDVMGKGIPAALLGAAVKSRFLRDRSSLISISGGALPEAVDIVGAVHQGITTRLMELESFVTVCYVRFDLKLRQTTLVSCGHPSVIHYQKADKTCRLLGGRNFPLGFVRDYDYQETRSSFEAGDVFVVYSDGVTESRNGRGEMFGESRLQECISSLAHLGPHELIRQTRTAIMDFTQGSPLTDDLTIVAVRIEEAVPYSDVVHRTMTVNRRLEELATVRQGVAKFCRETFGQACPERYINEFQLGIQEALTNIMRHASGAESPILLEMDGFVNRAAVRLTYEGPAFDPAAVRLPRVEEYPSGGFGLFVLSRSVDTIRYVALEDGQNCVHLVKFLPV